MRGGTRWERWWFAPGSALRLDAWRVVLMLLALYALHFFDGTVAQHAAGVEGVHRRWVPIYAFELLGLGPFGPGQAAALRAALLVAILCGLVGLFTRAACAAVAVLLFLWVGAAYSIGKPHHEFHVLALALFALPVGPVGRRLSVDAWWRARRGLPRPPDEAQLARLPLRFAQVCAVLSYFFAGFTKLRVGGLDWMNGVTMHGIVAEHHAPWTELVVDHRWLLALMSVAVIGIQVSAPLALVWRPFRWVVVPAAALFHLGSDVTMETWRFLGLWATLLAFAHLERVPAFLRRVLTTGGVVRRTLAALVVVAVAVEVTAQWLRWVPAWWVPALLAAGACALLPGRFPLALKGPGAEGR